MGVSFQGNMGTVFAALILTIVVLALAPTVATSVSGAQGNVSDAGADALYGLINLLWSVGGLAAAGLVAGFRITKG